MGGRIPEQIRKDVIRKWLLGLRRDVIAKETDIGKGTVSEIINQYSSKDSEVELSNDKSPLPLEIYKPMFLHFHKP